MRQQVGLLRVVQLLEQIVELLLLVDEPPELIGDWEASYVT